MSLPCEQINSIKNTRAGLLKLLDPAVIRRVPLAVRVWARQVLHHYPADSVLDDWRARLQDTDPDWHWYP